MDTSVWVNHLRSDNPVLVSLLYAEEVCVHPFVIGEILLGSLKNRAEIGVLLNNLPQCASTTADETLAFISQNELFGRGIGYVDASLLVSVSFTPDTTLWTFDKRLHAVATELGIEKQSRNG